MLHCSFWDLLLHALQAKAGADEQQLISFTNRLLEVLSTASTASLAVRSGSTGSGAGDPDIGSALASGELPHAEASVIYVLRVAVIEQLSEAGQVGHCLSYHEAHRCCLGAAVMALATNRS